MCCGRNNASAYPWLLHTILSASMSTCWTTQPHDVWCHPYIARTLPGGQRQQSKIITWRVLKDCIQPEVYFSSQLVAPPHALQFHDAGVLWIFSDFGTLAENVSPWRSHPPAPCGFSVPLAIDSLGIHALVSSCWWWLLRDVTDNVSGLVLSKILQALHWLWLCLNGCGRRTWRSN